MDRTKKKLRIIKIVEELQNDRYINWLLKVLEVLKILPTNSSFTPPPINTKEAADKEAERMEKILAIGRQPMPDHIDLEELKKEQGYDPKKLAETLKNWDYSLFADDSLEDLLNSLTK